MGHSPLILAPEGVSLTDWECAFFRECDPVGFILFARNVDTPYQLASLTASLRDAVGRDALILIDQEGGRVQRLGPPHWRQWAPPLDCAGWPNAARVFWIRYRIIADELARVGITANCAPTCDIASGDTHPFLMNRCLGQSAEQVTQNARASANGLLAGGVLPVLKHMPGHGRAKVDSHHSLPHADVPLFVASDTDFAPFRALADIPLGMTAHITFAGAGPQPATQNAGLIDAIRNDIGFDGLLMTDDISMEALSGSVTERARASWAVGCDVVLHCNGRSNEMEALAQSAPALTNAAATRLNTALARRNVPETVDIAALEAELEALTP